MDAFLRFLIIALMSIGLSSATYIIDDSNTTVQYSPPGKWVILADSTYYNGTVTWCIGITSDNCTMTIPFTGTGITLYIVQYLCNFSVSIDGSTPMSFSFPEGSGQGNVTAYDKQALQSGSHILDLMLLNDTDSATVLGGGGDSAFWFDYAIVNETNAFPTPATTSNTVLPPTHTSANGHSGHSSVTAAAVGGTLGGIALIVAGILIFVCVLKANRSRPRPREFDSEYKPVPLNVELPVEVPSLPAVLSTPAMLPTTWQPAPTAASSEKRDLTSTSTPRGVAQYSTAATSSALTLPEEEAALLHRLCSFGLPPGDITRLIGILNGRSESTVEDMQVLHRLNTLNVPAEDVNLVVAAMQRPGQIREATQHSSYDDADISQFPAPPPLPEL